MPCAGAVEAVSVLAANLPSAITEAELMDFLNGAIVAAAGLSVEPFADAAPCCECIVDEAARTARLLFRTPVGASAAAELSGIECRGASLQLKLAGVHRRQLGSSPDGPLLLCSPAELLGESAPKEEKEEEEEESWRRPKANAARWYERLFRPGDVKAQGGTLGMMLRPPERSHYHVLQVPRTAEASEIRKAFVRRCRSLRVDRSSGPWIVAEFCRLTEARNVLISESRRFAYDRSRLAHEAIHGRLQYDPKAAAFMLRHATRNALTRTPLTSVFFVEVEKCFGDSLAEALPRIKGQSGSDLVLVTDPTQGDHFPPTILIDGKQDQVNQVCASVLSHMAECRGTKAAQDGFVLLPPSELLDRMKGQPILQSAVASKIWELTKAAMWLFEDRISVRGQYASIAVAMCQAHLEWQCQVLLPNGHVMDPWSFAFTSEKAGCWSSANGVPATEPDVATVRCVFNLAACTPPHAQPQSIVVNGIRVIDAMCAGKLRLCNTIIKLAVCNATYQEILQQPIQKQAEYICALLRLWTTYQIRMPLENFSRHQLTCVVAELRQLLLDPHAGVHMRARGFAAINDTVQEVGRWYTWTEMLAQGSNLHAFMQSVWVWLCQNRQHIGVVPPDWACMPPLAAVVLVICCGDNVKVDMNQGIFRTAHEKPAPPVPPPVMPVPQAVPPQTPAAAAPAAQQQAHAEKPVRRRRSPRFRSSTPSASRKRRRGRSRSRSRGRGRSRSRSRSRSRGDRENRGDRGNRGDRDDRGERKRSRHREEELPQRSGKACVNVKDLEGLSHSMCMEEIFSALPADSEGSVPLQSLIQEAQRFKEVFEGSERFSKKWFENHHKSFQLVPYKNGAPTTKKTSSPEWRVQLTVQARRRVAQRKLDRQESRSESQRKALLAEAAADLADGRLSAKGNNEVAELGPGKAAVLLCALAGRPGQAPAGLALALARRLVCKAGPAGASPKELHREIRPFTPALLMQVIADLEEKRHEDWDETCLQQLLQAAALDLHEYAGWPRASLPTAALSLRCASRAPFAGCLRSEHCLLVPAAVLRLEVEVSEEAALDTAEALFDPFSQACSWLATIFVLGCVPEAHQAQVQSGFAKLAKASELIGRRASSGHYEPEGLSRFAMAIALLAQGCASRWRGSGRGPSSGSREKDVGAEALDDLSRCLSSSASAEGPSWFPQHLATLATAYSLVEAPRTEVFRRIASVAERQAKSGLEWGSEHLWKFLSAAEALGLLRTVEGLLRTLQAKGMLLRHIMAAKPTDLPVLFSIAVLLDDPFIVRSFASLSDCFSPEHLKELSFEQVMQVLSAWPEGASERWACLDAVKLKVLEAAASSARSAKLGDLSASEAQSLLGVLADRGGEHAPQLLRSVAEAPSVMVLAPESGLAPSKVCAQVMATLRPFATHSARAPALEGLCAARLLVSMHSVDKLDLDEVGDAFRDLAGSGALVSMPTVVATLASAPALVRAAEAAAAGPGEEGTEVEAECKEAVVGDLLALLLRGARDRGDVEAGSAEAGARLDAWARRVEDLAAEAADSAEAAADDVEQDTLTFVELTSLVENSSVAKEAEAALGPSWLEVLMMRSLRLSWDGGQLVQRRPPQPRAATQRLAEAAAGLEDSMPGLLGYFCDEEAPPLWPPDLLVRSNGDPSMKQTVAGTYVACGENHGKPLYRRSSPGALKPADDIILYYWDEREGAEHVGWWFGPTVGSDLIWAHHEGSPEQLRPPKRGWKVKDTGNDSGDFTVVCLDRARIVPPGPPPRELSEEKAPPEPSEAGGGKLPACPLSPSVGRSLPEPDEEPPAIHPWGPAIQASAAAAASAAEPSAAEKARRAAALNIVATPQKHGARRQAHSDAKEASVQEASFEKLRRMRDELKTEREQQLSDWLLGLDEGAGVMLQYFDVLCAEFDADLTQIAAVKGDGTGVGLMGAVDPVFWETVKVRKMGHRMLFARGISRL